MVIIFSRNPITYNGDRVDVLPLLVDTQTLLLEAPLPGHTEEVKDELLRRVAEAGAEWHA